jgi:ribosomal protein L23
MSNKWFLVQTEKSLSTQQNNVFVIASMDKNLKTNKIELTKELEKNGVQVVKISSLNTYKKIKSRGKKRTAVKQFRPKKWFVKLNPGQVLTDEIINKLN